MAFNLDVPEPEYIETDDQARELLHLAMRKVERCPGELIGFDTETHGKKLPFKVGTRKPLDWMGDTVLLWSLSFFDDDQGRYRRWCLQQQHLQPQPALSRSLPRDARHSAGVVLFRYLVW